MMEQKFNRRVAHHLPINDIYKHELQRGGGEYDPHYIDVNGTPITRVNIVGTIIDDSISQAQNITVDDGSNSILIREFQETPGKTVFVNLQMGDIVRIIGKVKEYNNQRYILAEIIAKTTDHYLMHHQLQNKLFAKQNKGALPETQPQIKPHSNPQPQSTYDAPHTAQQTTQAQDSIIEESIVEEPRDPLLQTIKQLDDGEGADIQDILKQLPNAEPKINALLSMGEIFMVKPGKIKLLD